MKVEKFKITNYNDNFEKYEKMNLQSVKATLVEDEINSKTRDIFNFNKPKSI